MSDVRVASEAVRDAGTRAQALVEEFVDALSQCDSTASGLLAQSWSGPASEMFSTGWSEWHRGAAEVHSALAGIAQLLRESAVQYETTETAVTQVSKDSSVAFGDAR